MFFKNTSTAETGDPASVAAAAETGEKTAATETNKQDSMCLADELAALIAEQKRRKKTDRLARYNTGPNVHEKQMAFHRADARSRWVFGGNRSGKTECGAVEAVWLARGIHPYKKNSDSVSGWVVSLSTQVQRDVAQAKILAYLNPRYISDIVMLSGSKSSPSSGVIDFLTVKNELGGTSRIGFKSCDQGREKFQGASLDFVWFDEEPPEDIYEECRMRLLDREGMLFATMTPLKGLDWVYQKIYRREETDDELWTTSMEWDDNPFLSKKEIARMSAAMSEDELRSRRYGQFRSCNGLVYSEFDPAVHVIPPFDVPKNWYNNISIDPGLNNPTSVHWYAVDGDGTVYVVAEHYEAGRDIAYHASRIKTISERLGWHRGFGGKINALIDSAANQRTLAASKSVAELFYDEGISVSTAVDKDVFGGIARVKGYLKPAVGKPKIYIFETCPKMIREIKGYFWGAGDIPKKRDDHAMDELRYFIGTRPRLVEPPAQKSEITRDKERLMRKLSRGNKFNVMI